MNRPAIYVCHKQHHMNRMNGTREASTTHAMSHAGSRQFGQVREMRGSGKPHAGRRYACWALKRYGDSQLITILVPLESVCYVQ